MKFSFEISRSSKKSGLTGASIKSPVAKPEYAEMLRSLAGEGFQRMYDSALTNNMNQDFPSKYGSANAEVLTSLYISRGRARTLVTDYPWGKGIVRQFRNQVCGDDPFRLEMRAGKTANGVFKPDSDANKKVEDAWKEAGKPANCTVRRDMSRAEMYHTIIASVIRDGSILARHRNAFKNKFGYAIQLIESDRLQESYMGKATNGNQIRFSIERDQFDAPTAYYILSRHPGDLFDYNGFRPNTWRERVPAEEIIHVNNIRERAEQDVGFPELDSIIQTLHRDRQFDIAHVTAAIWSCCKPWWITQELPTGIPYAADGMALQMMANATGGESVPVNAGAESGRPGDARMNGVDRVEILTPSQGSILPYGRKVQQIDPRFPMESAASFKRNNGLDIASGAGLSYGSVTSDFDKYSFSVARFAVQPERDNFKVYQKLMILNFVELHFRAWLKSALEFGQIDLPIERFEELASAANFYAKRWPYIQPVQDVQADIEAIEARLKSPQEVFAESENGRCAEEVLADIAEFEQMAKDHKVELGEVTKPTIAKGPPSDNPTQPNSPTNQNGNGSRFSMNGKH